MTLQQCIRSFPVFRCPRESPNCIHVHSLMLFSQLFFCLPLRFAPFTVQCQRTLHCDHTIWATSWENLFMPYANNKGADQTARMRSLISTFVVRCLNSILSLVSISEISSLYLASVAAQVGLCFTWLQTPKTGFLVTRLICVSTSLPSLEDHVEVW